MKINTQTIPPALAAAYAKLISRKPTLAGAAFVARTKPRATKKAPTRKPRTILKDYENAVDFLIAYLTKKNGTPPAPTFRAAQIAALKAGTFDPAYWAKCAEASSTTLENAPTSGAFVGIRNYAYPDPANQPSTPTYGAGVPATGDPAYTGWTTAGTFADTSLRWIRKVYTLKNKFTRNTPEPLFLKLSGNITATANYRPSRAMISAIIKRWIVAAGSARLTTTEAPVIKPISAFWRYKTPRGIAPYFALTKPLSLMYSARSPDYEELTGDLTSAIVLVAPMPMMGKRYNNNTSITSTIAATIELWQIKKGAEIICGYSTISGSERAWKYDGIFSLLGVPAGGTTSSLPKISTDGNVIVGYGLIAGIDTAWKWTTATGMISLGKPAGATTSRAIDCTNDGSTIIGTSTVSGKTESWTWTALAGFTYLTHSTGQSNITARAISADGTTIVGLMTVAATTHAWKWTAATGIIDIGMLSGGTTNAATDCSANGEIIIGTGTVAGLSNAWKWTALTGFTVLGLIPGATQVSALCISADGSTVTGYVSSGTPFNLWKWTAAGGMVALGFLPGGSSGQPRDISPDGQIIVGYGTSSLGTQAFRWTAATGMVGLGFPAGSTGSRASGISAT